MNKMVGWILGIAVAVLVAAFLFVPLAYSPVWLFTKYRGLRRFIIAQAKHETGNFTSDLYSRSGNAFGMKLARIRPKIQFQFHPQQVYAHYLGSPSLSLIDYLLRAENFNMPTHFDSVADFALWLKESGYYSDSLFNYTNGIKNWLDD